MKILVRLPNWLGDAVMAVGFLHQLNLFFPGAAVSVVIKKALYPLLDYFPETTQRFLFEKEKYGGLKGPWRFGREIRKNERFDLFVCLPDSFSSAVMGYATGAKQRIGFKSEGRSLLLTHAYHKPQNKHRAEEYVSLLEQYCGKKEGGPQVLLHHSLQKEDYVVVNINSEASSRRFTTAKAIAQIDAVRKTVSQKIILIGAPKEKLFVDDVYNGLATKAGIENRCGQTTLSQLIALLASAQLLLSTDSGPAHLANALGTYTIVLFGAGDEYNTAPYQTEHRSIIRLNKLPCEPCRKNKCMRYDTPQCLQQLDTEHIAAIAGQQLQKSKNG